jgi:hypothetical protein
MALADGKRVVYNPLRFLVYGAGGPSAVAA